MAAKFITCLVLLALAAPLALAYPASYDISQTAAAKAEAQARHLPIAYVGIVPGVLGNPSPDPGSDSDLANMALAALDGHAVIITFNGENMAPVPTLVHMEGFHPNDDGPLEGGAAWVPPKIVFTDPAVTKILGRVSHTQMAAQRDAPIRSILASIQNDPNALNPKPAPPPPPADLGGDSQDSGESPPFGTIEWGKKLVQDRWQYFLIGGGVLALALVWRPSRNQ